MTETPDAWDDEWSAAADAPAQETESKKLSSKQTKAQKRAAQAEFNRQLWAEAEGPSETNYFLESRNVVPLRQEFKAAPTLLSRKGPIVQKPRSQMDVSLEGLKLKDKEESSEDEDEVAAQQRALEAAKIRAIKDREEKQRKYEERRLELFGPSSTSSNGRPASRSGNSTPASLTPPGSRSGTPHRGGKRGRGRGNNGGQNNPRHQHQQQQQQQSQQPSQHQYQQQFKEVYDPAYAAKPGSTFLLRRETGQTESSRDVQPIREPRAPDGSGRGGAGFVSKRRQTILNPAAPAYQVSPP